jgi:hypothetical protein
MFVIYNIKMLIKERLVFAFALFLLVIYFASKFFGALPIIENAEATSSFYGFGSRLLLSFGAILTTAIYFRRYIDSGEINYWTVMPKLSRPKFYLSFYLAVFLVLSSLCLLSKNHNLIPIIAVMIAFSQMLAIRIASPVSVFFISLGFFVISHLSGYFILMHHNYQGGTLMLQVLYGLLHIFPRFDISENWLQAGLYTSLLLAMGVSEILRKVR